MRDIPILIGASIFFCRYENQKRCPVAVWDDDQRVDRLPTVYFSCFTSGDDYIMDKWGLIS